MLALSKYPDNQPLRFSRRRWIALCEKHAAKDNDPPYRDEQRAWYDTLRDLVPLLNGLKPTLRLYAVISPGARLPPIMKVIGGGFWTWPMVVAPQPRERREEPIHQSSRHAQYSGVP